MQESHNPENLHLDIPENNPDREEATSFLKKASLGIAAVSLTFQQSPANEISRGYVGLSVLDVTSKPLLAGLAFGMATFAIEAVTGSSAAYALRNYSEKIHSFKDKIFTKFNKDKPNTYSESKGLFTDSILALSIGSAGVVARKHYHEKDRTAQEDYKTVAKAAGGIALASTVIAYGGATLINRANGTRFEGFVNGAMDVLTDWKTYVIGGVAIGSVIGLRRLYSLRETLRKDNQLELGEINQELIDYDKRGFVSMRIDDHNSELAKSALKFEQEIWDKKGYGSLDDYNEKYLQETRLYATFKNNKCIGTTRIFTRNGSEILPPFINDMDYYDAETKAKLAKNYNNGLSEELATSAIENSTQTRNVIRSLWRLAYRDSLSRGVTEWGIIMEPRRAKILNRMNAFTFAQVGPEKDYQGGMCAPHVMDLRAVFNNMKAEKPELFDWFIEQPLNRSF